MAIIKCKMCGGDLNIVAGASTAECDFCGSVQTVPNANDENLQNLFNRANTLRIKSEFDKAEKLYEKIVQADSTQADAYWGLILCKYGIEYVDDPSTFKKIPTCHRASYDSIIADEDYKSALSYADAGQRAIYEEQAREIDRIQKDILALAQKEETYDVFICYKETDASGHRTQDSVIANDIYYQLTQEGFKVFYAAITLEGKLGSAYEPIIFAALNSAKVMLSIGTKPEYFNAVWVKNEWSRFLKIIKKDRSKLLIPCYRDMDAYELPEEFAHLQAQDMSKIGFINDVVRGIKKVVQKDEPKQTVVKETVVETGNTNTAPLLKRAFMFLEDGDWERADEFCEQVLNIDPECAEAYLGKQMAQMRINKQENMKDAAAPLENHNYQKMLRFADKKLKKALGNYIVDISNLSVSVESAKMTILDFYIDGLMYTAKDISESCSDLFIFGEGTNEYGKNKTPAEETAEVLLEYMVREGYLVKKYDRFNRALYATAKTEKMYVTICTAMASASTESEYKELAQRFEAITAYMNVGELLQECLEKAEAARKNTILADGKAKMAANKIEHYEAAIALFASIPGWEDSDEQIELCQVAIERIKTDNEIARNENIYSKGVINMSKRIARVEDLEVAIKEFKKIPGWKDADELLAKCQKKIEEIKAKAEADRLERERQAEIAGIANARKKKRNIIIGVSVSVLAVVIIITLILLDNYVWTPNQYRAAIELYEAGKYTDAVEEFSDLGTYEDSENWAKKSKYEYILSNKNNKDRTTYEYLKSLKVEGYKDCMSIYDELYAWNVEFVINKSETDTKNNTIYKVKPGDIFYVHVNVSGGYPGGHVYVTPQYRLPLSYFSWETLDNSGSYSDGESKCVWFKAGSEAHTLYLQAKIGDEVVASTSIEIDK